MKQNILVLFVVLIFLQLCLTQRPPPPLNSSDSRIYTSGNSVSSSQNSKIYTSGNSVAPDPNSRIYTSGNSVAPDPNSRIYTSGNSVASSAAEAKRNSQLQYPPQNSPKGRYTQVDYKQLSKAFETIFKFNLKLCTNVQRLKFFAIKAGVSNSPIIKYLTVQDCSGPLSFKGPSYQGRAGDDQLFTVSQLQDQTWLFQPRRCPDTYIKASNPTTLSLSAGLSANARHWIQYHNDHVHIQSAAYLSTYWGGDSSIQIGPGASKYIVQFWPQRPWP